MTSDSGIVFTKNNINSSSPEITTSQQTQMIIEKSINPIKVLTEASPINLQQAVMKVCPGTPSLLTPAPPVVAKNPSGRFSIDSLLLKVNKEGKNAGTAGLFVPDERKEQNSEPSRFQNSPKTLRVNPRPDLEQNIDFDSDDSYGWYYFLYWR